MLQLSGWGVSHGRRPLTAPVWRGQWSFCRSIGPVLLQLPSHVQQRQQLPPGGWRSLLHVGHVPLDRPDCHTFQAWHCLCCGPFNTALRWVWLQSGPWLVVDPCPSVTTTSPVSLAPAAVGDSETLSDPPGLPEVAPASMATPGTPDVPLLPMSTPLYQTDSAGGLDGVPAPCSASECCCSSHPALVWSATSSCLVCAAAGLAGGKP